VHRDQQVALRLKAEARQDAGAPDRVLVAANHLRDRIADHEEPLARDPLAQKVRAAALGVRLRMSLTIPFMVQMWLFISPVAYPSSLVPKPWDAVYGINPMVGVIEGFRWALLGQSEPSGPMLAVSALMVAVLLGGGLLYFRRMERSFADVV